MIIFKQMMGGASMNAPLYIKTDYSLLQSMIKIDDLIAYAKKNNVLALTITDDNLSGVYEFYQKCQKNNIKPIIGLEIMIDGEPIVLYAKNYQGYQALIKINLIDNIQIDDLASYGEHLVCVVPFSSLNLYHYLNKIFTHIYQCYSDEKEKEAITSGKKVFLRPILYLQAEEKKYLRYLKAIKEGLTCEEIKPSKEDYHFSYQTTKENEEIVNLCQLTMPATKPKIPQFKPNEDSYELLKKHCKEGMRNRFGDVVNRAYIERLKYELQVIRKMQFCDYFLIVQDFVNYAKKEKILVGPGRGSAAGSLVSYCLGITDVDPLKYDLLFERFLNPERSSMPDIDIDFADDRREEVIHYCMQKYGNQKVAPIITFGTLGSKQVLRDVGRVLMVDLTKIDKLCKKIDPQKTLQANRQNPEVQKLLSSSELKNVYQIALQFVGLKRHTSIHAAGVIMSDEELTNIIPLVKRDDNLVAAYTMEYLEALGLLKMDFLGLKNLTIMDEVLKQVGMDFSEIPLQDEKTMQLFQKGATVGVFQFESGGMMKFLQNLQPVNFADVYAAIALYRPGPMNNLEVFIRRKQQKEKITYYHPDLTNILKPTYGVIVYQEQIMQIAHLMGGYSMAEADVLRKAMSKKKKALLAREKEKFIKNATQKNYSAQVAEEIFALILKFAEYGFNKAHSVSYAIIAFKMAYLKAHYPHLFLATLLNHSLGSDIKTKEYINECRRFQVPIVALDVNKSGEKYIGEKGRIIPPLLMIKNVGRQTVAAILKARQEKPFQDIFDFVSRIDRQLLNENVLKALILVGALDNFGYNRQTLFNNMERLLNYGDLNFNMGDAKTPKPEIVVSDEFTSAELLAHEQAHLGVYLKEHPVSEFKAQAERIIALNQVDNYFDRNITVIGIVEKFREIETKKKEKMAFLTIADEYDNLEVVIFPKQYQDLDIAEGDIVKINGKVEKRYDQWQLVFSGHKKLKKG